MNLIIAGSRSAINYEDLLIAMKDLDLHPSTIISGTANGADSLGERYAREFNIPLKRFPADWKRYGKCAGMIRNKEMAKCADCLLALWDCSSVGTMHMINYSTLQGLTVYVFNFLTKKFIHGD
jgi:hypothetical protein